MKNTLMIDLETTGKRPGCCILTIGAAGIDKNGLEVNFYAKISYDKSKAEGFDDDPETLAWWRKQDTATLKEAFSGTTEGPQDVVPLTELDKDNSKIYENSKGLTIARTFL